MPNFKCATLGDLYRDTCHQAFAYRTIFNLRLE
jgi:hypothetical protein